METSISFFPHSQLNVLNLNDVFYAPNFGCNETRKSVTITQFSDINSFLYDVVLSLIFDLNCDHRNVNFATGIIN